MENVTVQNIFDKNFGNRPYGTGKGREEPGWARSSLCSGTGPALSRPHKFYSRNFYQKYSAQSIFPGHSSSLMTLVTHLWYGTSALQCDMYVESVNFRTT